MAAPRVALRGNVMASSRKKIYIFKKLALSKKQNKTTVTKKNKQKGKKKRKEEKKKNSFRPESNSGSSTCRAVSLPLHHMLIISQRNGKTEEESIKCP